MRKSNFVYAKIKAQISCAMTAPSTSQLQNKGYNVGWFRGHFFHIFEIVIFVCFVVAIFDRVHDVVAIHSLC